MRVNLLAGKRRVFSFNWVRLLFAVMVIVLLFLLGANYYLSSSKLVSLEKEIKILDKQMAMILPKKQEYIQLQKKIKNLEKKEKEIEAAQYYWDEVVEEQGYIIPERLMLTLLQINNNRLLLQGIAANNQEVLQFINNLKTSPFFYEVKLHQLSRKDEVNFKIEAVIKGRGD